MTRPFCLKEIGWALEAKKPIVIVAEVEERFWPFDIGRWERDECTKNTSVWPHRWDKTLDLGSNYASCLQAIKEEIRRQHTNGLFLPYRRRDFEAKAMVQRIFSCSGSLGCPWAKYVPKSMSTKTGEVRKLFLICDTSTSAGATTHALRVIINDNLTKALKAQDDVELVNSPEEATHALVVLTGGLLVPTGTMLPSLTVAVKRLAPVDVVYIYSLKAGWIFYGSEQKNAPAIINQSISNHEALVCRTLPYEHVAMVGEVLRRLRPKLQKQAWDI